MNWLVPLKFHGHLVRIVSRLTGAEEPANRKLAGRHAGSRCFVIGNGPSMKGMDLSPLADEIVIAANSFYKHPDATAARADYLCVGDESFMVDEPRAIEWHRTLEREHPAATLLLHPRARSLIEKHGLYRQQSVHYFRQGPAAPYPELVEFDLSMPLSVGHTTGSLLAVPLAIFLGCTEVILLGFDCNWLEGLGKSYHFYDEHEHFPEFDSVLADGRWTHYEDMLRSALREFESHRFIAQRARQLGVTILNATAGGVLDTYKRIEYEEVLRASAPSVGTLTMDR